MRLLNVIRSCAIGLALVCMTASGLMLSSTTARAQTDWCAHCPQLYGPADQWCRDIFGGSGISSYHCDGWPGSPHIYFFFVCDGDPQQQEISDYCTTP